MLIIIVNVPYILLFPAEPHILDLITASVLLPKKHTHKQTYKGALKISI